MPLAPKKLAIYYGWPSTVNATYSVSGAAAVFADYDIVVFGDGLQNSGHGDHDNTSDIIDHTDMADTEVYGYVDAVKGISDMSGLKTDIDNWHAMGGSNQKTAGIFVDQFGYDYEVTRAIQNEIVDYIHGKTGPTLKAFVNAWAPEDALGNDVVTTYNPSGTAHKIATDDWYLCESYASKDNDYDDTDTDTDGKPDWMEKAEKIIADYNGDCLVATVGTTGSSSAGFTQAIADYSYWATAMFGFDAWGWGEKNYSSAGGAGSLPFRTRKTLPEGTKLHSGVSKTGDVIESNTNVGFHLDLDDHSLDTRLD